MINCTIFRKKRSISHGTKVLSLLFLASASLFTSCKKEIMAVIEAIPETSAIEGINIVTTIAGSTQGFTDGIGSEAQFSLTFGVAADLSGNVYVADTENNRIRKITKEGLVSTLAGNGFKDAQGKGRFEDGIGTEAMFDRPSGIAVDIHGNVYVADTYNNRIRKITTIRVLEIQYAIVSTLAGQYQGFTDGIGTEAGFTYPVGIAVDVQGNVYASDSGNHSIRKITPSGKVITLAGSGYEGFTDGVGTEAEFNHPAAVAVDVQGNVYVADSGNHSIRKITPSKVTTTLAGNGSSDFEDGFDGTAQFDSPQGVAVDVQGNVYVADTNNQKIRKITNITILGVKHIIVSTLAGSIAGYNDGALLTARFYNPSGIAVDARGTMYIADIGNHKIRKTFYFNPEIN